jgi:Fe-S-cluster containining protein
MDSSPLRTQQQYSELIEEVYRLSEPAVIDCAGSCNGSCETERTETVLFLPYELEYILERAGLKENPFQEARLLSGRYGMMDYHRNCPFLLYKGCGIRPLRPFDCRSFPIVPRFPDSPLASLEFYLAPYCPLKDRLSASYIDCIVGAWEMLMPHLPPDWREFYNSISHYQERLFPGRTST